MSQSCVKLASCLIGWHRPILVRLLGSRPLLRCPSLCVPACLFSHGLSRSDILRVLMYLHWSLKLLPIVLLSFFFKDFIYSLTWERDRVGETVEGGGRWRGRETWADSELSGELSAWFGLTTPGPWPELKTRAGHLTDWGPRHPWFPTFFLVEIISGNSVSILPWTASHLSSVMFLRRLRQWIMHTFPLNILQAAFSKVQGHA